MPVRGVSRYAYLIEGKKAEQLSMDARLKPALEQIRNRIDPRGVIIARGQRLLDMITKFRVKGDYKLPRLIIRPETLAKFEECGKPQDILPLAELESFLDAYQSGDQANIDRFLEKHGIEMVGAFPLARKESGKLMLMSGPSGVGKGTVQEKFLVPDGLPKWVLFNIRDRRSGELNGVMYYYVNSEKDIANRCRNLFEMYKNGAFIASAVVHQSEIANIAEKRSQGVGKNLFELIAKGEDWFAEVDLKLAAQLIMRGRKEGLKVNYVFLLPSRFEDLVNRIIKRTLLKKGGDPDKITEAEIDKMRERMINAQGEIAFSFLLHPNYVINVENQEEAAGKETRIALGFRPRKAAAIAKRTGGKISGRVTVDLYEEKIQEAKNEEGDPLELLPANYPIILSIPGEVNPLLRTEIGALVKREGNANIPSLLKLMEEKVQAAVWEASGNPAELAAQLHSGQEQKYTVGIQPGTLAPYHFGHTSFAQAAILDAGLAGVTVLSGGDPPEKPFVVAPHHREAMVRLGLLSRPYLYYSPIRVQMAQILRGVEMGGKNEEENRRLRDLAAFSFLVSMNTHLKWNYITGVDKVNNYGVSGKNEKDLMLDLLINNGISLLYYLRGDMRFELFDREEAFLAANPGKSSWVLENRELIDRHLIEGSISSHPISATEVRKMVEENISLLDVIPEQIIGYIYDHDLRRAYVLENKAKWLKDHVRHNKISSADAQKFLESINQERAALFNLGILANGHPLTLKDILEL